jgi:hypothetical protein
MRIKLVAFVNGLNVFLSEPDESEASISTFVDINGVNVEKSATSLSKPSIMCRICHTAEELER